MLWGRTADTDDRSLDSTLPHQWQDRFTQIVKGVEIRKPLGTAQENQGAVARFACRCEFHDVHTVWHHKETSRRCAGLQRNAVSVRDNNVKRDRRAPTPLHLLQQPRLPPKVEALYQVFLDRSTAK